MARVQFGVDLRLVKPGDQFIFKLNVSIPLVNKYKVYLFIFSIKSYFQKDAQQFSVTWPLEQRD